MRDGTHVYMEQPAHYLRAGSETIFDVRVGHHSVGRLFVFKDGVEWSEGETSGFLTWRQLANLIGRDGSEPAHILSAESSDEFELPLPGRQP